MGTITQLGTSASWSRLTNTAGFSTDPLGNTAIPLPAAATLPTELVSPAVSNGNLSYYVRFTPSSAGGVPGPFDGSTLYQVNEFSVDASQFSRDVGDGKVSFAPLMLTFSQQTLTPGLLTMLASGSHFGEVDVLAYNQQGPLVADYSFGLVFASDLSTDSSGATNVSFEYGSEEIRTYTQAATGGITLDQSASWNRVLNIAGFSTDGSGTAAPPTPATTLPTALVSPAVSNGNLSYYVRFTPSSAGGVAGPFDGSTLYQVNEFSVDASQFSRDVGDGKVSFAPLMLTFSQQTLTPGLLTMLASGSHFGEVDVLAYNQQGPLVADYSFGLVFASDLSTDSSGATNVSFEYGSEEIRTYTQAATGGITLDQSASWNRVLNIAGFSTDGSGTAAPPTPVTTLPTALVSPAVSNGNLSYYVRFTPSSAGGVPGPFDGSTLYQVNEFSVDAAQFSRDVGDGKVSFAPLMLTFSQQTLTPGLLTMLASGSHFGEVDVLAYNQQGPLVADYSFGLVFASDLSTDSSGATNVSFDYGSEEIRTYTQAATGGITLDQSASWNRVLNIAGFSTDGSGTAAPPTPATTLPTALVSPAVSNGNLSYYVRFTPSSAGGVAGPFDGSTLYQVNEFSVDASQFSRDVGDGKVSFAPLMLTFSQQTLTPGLLTMLASGSHFGEVDVLAYNQQGPLVADYSFGLVFASDLSTDSSGATNVSFDYGSEEIRTYTQAATGGITLDQSASWNRVLNIAGFSTDGSGTAAPPTPATTLPTALVSPAVSNGNLSYYVRFTPSSAGGVAGPFDGSTLYQVNEFSVDASQFSRDVGDGKVSFAPLMLTFSQQTLTPGLLTMLASGSHFGEVDVLAYNQQGPLVADYSFGLVFASDLSTDSSGATNVSFDYGSEEIRTYTQAATGGITLDQSASWNRVLNIAGFSTDGSGTAAPPTPATTLPTALVSPAVSNGNLSYYVRFTPSSAGGVAGPFDGSTLYQVNEFSVDASQFSRDVGDGKVSFAPLMLTFSQQTLTPGLLTMLASGSHFGEVDVLAYNQQGPLVADYSFGLVFASDLSTDSSGATNVSFDYGSEEIRTFVTSASPTPAVVEAGQTTVIATVTTPGLVGPAPAPTTLPTALVSPAVSNGNLSYYVRFTPSSAGGVPGPFDGSTLYQVNEFSVDASQFSRDVGDGKVSFAPLMLTFSQQTLTPGLLTMLASGSHFGEVDVLAYNQQGPLVADYSFGLVFASDLSTDSSGATNVSFDYGSEEIRTYTQAATGGITLDQSASWNRVLNIAGFSTDGSGTAAPPTPATTLPTALVSPAVSNGNLSYYVRFTPSSAGGVAGPFDGSTLYQVNEFSVDASQFSRDVGDGKVSFAPLMLTFSQQTLTPGLLTMLASGSHFGEVDVLAYNQQGPLVADYSFGLVFASDLSTDSSGATNVSFDYGSEEIRTYTQAATGGITLDQSASWNRVLNIAGFSTDGSGTAAPPTPATTLPTALVSPAVSNGNLSYYVRFTPSSAGGVAGPFDGSTLYQVNEFSVDASQFSRDVGDGKVSFAPLMLTFSQQTLTPGLLTMLASGSHFGEVDVLAYNQQGPLVADYSFGLVFASDLSTDSSGATNVSFDYGSEEIRTYTQAATGGITLDQSASWNRVLNIAGFSTDGSGTAAPPTPATTLPTALVSPAVSNGNLSYYVRFTPSSAGGVAGPFDGSTLYQVNEFSVDASQFSRDVGDGKVSFAPLMLTFSQQTLTPGLLTMLASGSHFGEVDVLAYNQQGPLVADYSFGLVFASDLSTDSSGATNVSFEYGSEEIRTYTQAATGGITLDQSASWNRVLNIAGFSTDGSGTAAPPTPATTLPTALVSPAVSNGNLSYYVRFTPSSAGGVAGPFDGSTLYQVNEFSVDASQFSRDVGDGKVSFAPLMLTFSQQTLTPGLLTMLASGSHFGEVDVLAYNQQGPLVADYSFGLVFASDLSTESSGATNVSFDYGSEEIRTYTQAATGGITLDQSASWNRVLNIAGFSTDGSGTAAPPTPATTLPTALVSPAVSNGNLSYYVRFTPSSAGGVPGPFDGSTLYQVNEFSVDAAQFSRDVGDGKVSFAPLMLTFSQQTLTPGLLTMLASGSHFGEVDVLAYNQQGPLVADYSFGLVFASDLSTESSGATNVSFDYSSEEIRTYTQAATGGITLDQSASWNRVLNIAGFSTDGSGGITSDSLTLIQAPGSLGTVSLGPITNGALQVIYTAPTAISANILDPVSYTIVDQQNGVIASGSNGVRLDAGPGVTDTTSVGEKVAHGTTVAIGTATPGLTGDTLTLTELSGPTAAVTLTGTTVNFSAPVSASGPVSFSYQISDQRGGVTGVISDTLAVDPGPTAGAVTTTVNLNTSKDLTGVILVVDKVGLSGDALTLAAINVTGTAGSVTLNNGTLTYTANGTVLNQIPANGSATDTFGYTVSDQLGETAKGTATVTVSNPATVVNGSTAGHSTIQGTTGTNIINASGSGNVIFANGGNDVINAGASQATVYVNTGNVVVTLSGAYNLVQGFPGTGAVATAGADGNVTVKGTASNGTVLLGNGQDNVNLIGDQNTVKLGTGNDGIILSGNKNVVVAGDGNNTVSAIGGLASVSLGKGTNIVTLSSSKNSVTLGAGSDTVNAGTGDTIQLTATHLTLKGGSGAMVFLGSAPSLDDLSTGMTAVVGPLSGNVIISDLFKDATSLIDLTGGVGDYKSVTKVVQALKSDGHGGTMLSLGSAGSIDFVNTNQSFLTAAHFKIG